MRYKKVKQKSKKIKVGVKALLFLVIIFICVQVFFTVQQGALGVMAAKYQEESEVVLEDKKALEEELVKSDSLGELQRQAEGLGYTKADNIYYLKTGDQFAQASISTN